MAYQPRYPDPNNTIPTATTPGEILVYQKAEVAAQLVFHQYTDSLLYLANRHYQEIQKLPEGAAKDEQLAAFNHSMDRLYHHLDEFSDTENKRPDDGLVTGYYTPNKLHDRILAEPGLASGLLGAENTEQLMPGTPGNPVFDASPLEIRMARDNISRFLGVGLYNDVINRSMAAVENASPEGKLVFTSLPNTLEAFKARLPQAMVTPIILPEEKDLPRALGPGMPVASVDPEKIVERLGMLDIRKNEKGEYVGDLVNRCPSLQPGAPNRDAELAKVDEIQTLAYELFNAKDPKDRFDPRNPGDMQRMVQELPNLHKDPKYHKVWLGQDDPEAFLAKAERLQALVGSSAAMKEYLGFMVVPTVKVKDPSKDPKDPNNLDVNVAMVSPGVLTQSVDQLVNLARGVQPEVDIPKELEGLQQKIDGVMQGIPKGPGDPGAELSPEEQLKRMLDAARNGGGLTLPPMQSETPGKQGSLPSDQSATTQHAELNERAADWGRAAAHARAAIEKSSLVAVAPKAEPKALHVVVTAENKTAESFVLS